MATGLISCVITNAFHGKGVWNIVLTGDEGVMDGNLTFMYPDLPECQK